MRDKFLAVHENGEFFIEDSAAAVAKALTHGFGLSYYRIVIDPETNAPSLDGPVQLDTRSRAVVSRRERVGLAVAGRAVGSAEVDVPQE